MESAPPEAAMPKTVIAAESGMAIKFPVPAKAAMAPKPAIAPESPVSPETPVSPEPPVPFEPSVSLETVPAFETDSFHNRWHFCRLRFACGQWGRYRNLRRCGDQADGKKRSGQDSHGFALLCFQGVVNRIWAVENAQKAVSRRGEVS